MLYARQIGQNQAPVTDTLATIDAARADIRKWLGAHPPRRFATDAQIAEVTHPCQALIGFDKYDCWLDRSNVLWAQIIEIATRALDVSAMISAAVGEHSSGGAFRNQAQVMGAELYATAMKLIRLSKGWPAKGRELRKQQYALRRFVEGLGNLNAIEQRALGDLMRDWEAIVILPIDYTAALAFTARELRDQVLVPFETKAFHEAMTTALLRVDILGRLGSLVKAVFTFPATVLKDFMVKVGEGVGGGLAGIIKPLLIWVGIPALIGLGGYAVYKRYGKPPERKT
jgi:hypothetical protein